MIENKQVNLWRGSQEPPTLYHIWLKDERQLLRYDEDTKKWVVFLDSVQIAQIIDDFIDQLDTILQGSINGHPLKDNPVLNATDLLSALNGNYIKETDTVKDALKTIDTLLTTEVL